MSASHSKVVADHEGDLSSSQKPVLFLGFLFLKTDLLLEPGILNDLVQSRSNLRVQHLKNWKILSTKLTAKIFIPLTNQPAPLLLSITLLPMENQKKQSFDF